MVELKKSKSWADAFAGDVASDKVLAEMLADAKAENAKHEPNSSIERKKRTKKSKVKLTRKKKDCGCK